MTGVLYNKLKSMSSSFILASKELFNILIAVS